MTVRKLAARPYSALDVHVLVYPRVPPERINISRLPFCAPIYRLRTIALFGTTVMTVLGPTFVEHDDIYVMKLDFWLADTDQAR